MPKFIADYININKKRKTMKKFLITLLPMFTFGSTVCAQTKIGVIDA